MKVSVVVLLLFFILNASSTKAQLYYPPNSGAWETLSPDSLNWCPQKIQSLYDYLELTSSKAFIVLKDGKIVLEKYFGNFTADSVHQWNSAGKTLAAFMTGIAQDEGFLNISDTTSTFLGAGWTSMTNAQEEKILIEDQLAMVTGLDDGMNVDCTLPSCLNYLADPGDRWAYHNAPYTLIQDVIGNAVGQTLNAYINAKLTGPTGISGLYIPIGYNKVFFSKPRSMARFGLLLLSEGAWNSNNILNDPTYFSDMTNTANSFNPSYGYLTWLNGKTSYIVPGTQFSINQSLVPNAPADMYAALGKNEQILNVVPSQNLVIVRMGGGGGTLVGNQYNDSIWVRMNDLMCNLSVDEFETKPDFSIFPNPNNGVFSITELKSDDVVTCVDLLGQNVGITRNSNSIQISKRGVFFIHIIRNGHTMTKRIVAN